MGEPILVLKVHRRTMVNKDTIFILISDETECLMQLEEEIVELIELVSQWMIFSTQALCSGTISNI